MADITEIRHRIKSIQDTHQITKAMELISVSKMRKAMEKQAVNAAYFNSVRSTIKDIMRHSTDIRIQTHNRLDEEFVDRCREIVLAHISDPDLSVDLLARELGMSRTSTFKKLKSITGMTPNDFMKHVRLKEAMRLMVEGKYSITEIGYITGFSSSSYFAKCFAQEFKILPTEFVRRLENGAASGEVAAGQPSVKDAESSHGD